jgi:large subunit ribosomal protein L19e
MNLSKKKALAARTLGVGQGRIIFMDSRKEEIKEAITKQDMRDLKLSGAILIKEIGGRKTVKRRTKRRHTGKIKKKVNTRKKDYVIMTRKLRGYVKAMVDQGKLTKEETKDIRKKIRNKFYKSKANLREQEIENKNKLNPSASKKAVKKKSRKRK